MIRVLIVDDEAPARAKIRKLLGDERDVEITGEASNGDEAIDAIRTLVPDLVFLDIQMPRRDGFSVIEEIGADAMPPVVFVTAYDEHAIRAFEVHALDYLLKPFAPARFRRVLDRLRKTRGSEEEGSGLALRVANMLESVEASQRYLRRVMVRLDEEREILIPVDRIDLIQADRNYLRIRAGEREFRRRGAISDLADRLDPQRFIRINRSEIVRLDAIQEFTPWFHGDYRVTLRDGTSLMWSRRFRAKLKDDF